MEQPPAKRPKGGDGASSSSGTFVCAAADVVTFHALASTSNAALVEEIAAGGVEFEGEFFHQHFGDEEQIKGYEGLQVHIWFSAHTFHCWIEAKWTKRKPGADKLAQILSDAFPLASASKEALVQDIVATLTAGPGDLAPHGDVLASQKIQQSTVELIRFQLASTEGQHAAYVRVRVVESGNRVGASMRPCEAFAHPHALCWPAFAQGIHERMEPLLQFFIDGANSIDNEDTKWELLLAVKRQEGGHMVVSHS
jgi:histone acetyltransferase 1